MFGKGKGLSRRGMMKGALQASAYTAPAILSITTAQRVAAVSPPFISGGTVVFLRSTTATYTAQGRGFVTNLPFLFVLFNPPDAANSTMRPLVTDASGNFSIDIEYPLGVGTAPAPATVNGGNIFVSRADTFVGTPPATFVPSPTPLPPTATAPPILAPTRGGPPPGVSPTPNTRPP